MRTPQHADAAVVVVVVVFVVVFVFVFVFVVFVFVFSLSLVHCTHAKSNNDMADDVALSSSSRACVRSSAHCCSTSTSSPSRSRRTTTIARCVFTACPVKPRRHPVGCRRKNVCVPDCQVLVPRDAVVRHHLQGEFGMTAVGVT